MPKMGYEGAKWAASETGCLVLVGKVRYTYTPVQYSRRKNFNTAEHIIFSGGGKRVCPRNSGAQASAGIRIVPSAPVDTGATTGLVCHLLMSDSTFVGTTDGLRIIVLRRISAPFPPAASHRLLLSSLTAAIE